MISRMRRNGPERALFKEEPDSYDTRINRFGQYKNTPSLVWTREVIQNSADNGATKVQLTIERCKDRNVVTVSDNGTGMDRTTLQEKFLTMGGTGKGSRDSGESIGGFGEAKKVILLAWKAWQVVTTKNGVTTYARSENGGREYEIDSFRDGRPDGTEVSVLTWESTIYTINDIDFSSIVQKSNLDGKIQFSEIEFRNPGTATLPPINKQTLSHDSTKIYGRLPLPGNAKFTINDSQGRPAAKVYVEKAKNAHGSSIYYRAKGLWLWDKYVSIEKEGRISKIHLRIIVEFIVKTTTILSDNRDSIKDPVLRKGIDKIIQDVVTDPRLFVRGISKNTVLTYRGDSGSLSADEEAMRLSGMITRSIEAGGMVEKAIDHVIQKVSEKIEQKTEQSPIEMDEKVGMKMFEHALKNIKFEGEPDKKAIENLVKMAIRSPDIKLFVEEDLQMEGYEIQKKFKPESFTEEVKKILSLWAEMCRIVFTVRGSRKRFGIGFVFSKETIGLQSPSDLTGCDGFLMVNPYFTDVGGMSKLADISNIDHVKTMWSICIHECTHMIDDVFEHSELYAIRLTENIAKTASCWGLVKQLAVLIGSKKTEIEKAKFSKDIDLDFFFKDDLKKRSIADAKLEKYLAVVVEELSSKGGKIPQPEEYGLEVTTDLVNRIRSAASRSSDSMSSANKLVIESLKRKLEEKSKVKDPEKFAVIFKNPRGKR